jgi:hypothetical protein
MVMEGERIYTLKGKKGYWRVIAVSCINPELVKVEKVGTSEAFYVDRKDIKPVRNFQSEEDHEPKALFQRLENNCKVQD